MSCFYAGALYGLLLIPLIYRLPETLAERHLYALQWRYLVHAYAKEFSHQKLLSGGILVGTLGGCIYTFAAMAPFIAIDLGGMNSETHWQVLPADLCCRHNCPIIIRWYKS
jgi:hypothetical protein